MEQRFPSLDRVDLQEVHVPYSQKSNAMRSREVKATVRNLRVDNGFILDIDCPISQRSKFVPRFKFDAYVCS